MYVRPQRFADVGSRVGNAPEAKLAHWKKKTKAHPHWCEEQIAAEEEAAEDEARYGAYHTSRRSSNGMKQFQVGGNTKQSSWPVLYIKV